MTYSFAALLRCPATGVELSALVTDYYRLQDRLKRINIEDIV